MSERVVELVVSPEISRLRLDRYLGEALREQDVSREKIKRAIRDGACLVDGTLCTDVKTAVSAGQRIFLHLAAVETSVQPEAGELEILWQDSQLVILNKPAGLTVHPAPSCPEGTLVHRLLAYFPELRAQEGFRPGIVHRLDKDTSGLLCIALTEEARLRLSAAFAAREVHKEYLALVRGDLTGQGEIDEPLGRHPSIKTRMAVVKNGKPARSAWRVLDGGVGWALTAIRIFTGRTHQIRVHMAHIGHPLWGDAVYGAGKAIVPTPPGITEEPASRQMLHAWKLSFTHPFTGEAMTFCCPPPHDFFEAARALHRRMHRVVVTGSAGCGKSLFISTLVSMNVPVWSADAAVIRLYEAGGEAWQALRQRYGDRFIPDSRGPVDRRALAAALLPDAEGNPPQLDIQELNALLHPLVYADLESFWAEQERAGRLYAVAEVPLWFESGWGRTAEPRPLVVGIRCEETERRRRLLEVRGWSPAMMTEMDARQWSQDRKMAACNQIVENSGTPETLVERTRQFVALMEQWRTDDDAAFADAWKGLVQG